MLLEVAFVALLQVPAIINPGGLTFTCPDHAQDTNHEVDIINVETGQVEATLLVGDPPADAAGVVAVALNIQPIKFGQKRFQVRAVAGAEKSANSELSDVWRRSPGTPGKATVIK
jgi:hypothetical protein